MIRLSRITDYSITLLAQMVSDENRVWSATELTQKTGLPAPTTSKILKQLTKANILTAQRGATGGYKIAKSSAAMSVASIIEAMDGPIAITDCSDGGDHSCSVESTCPLTSNWNKVNQAIRQALENVSLADMAQGGTRKPVALPPLEARG